MKVRREKPIPDDQWRALAAQNPMRVTYPSWRPRSHWDAERKRDPWVLMNGSKDWRKADARKARFLTVVVGWMWPGTPALPPSGMKLEPRPEEWDRPVPSYRRRNW